VSSSVEVNASRYVPIECGPGVWRVWDDLTGYYACHHVVGSRAEAEDVIDGCLLWRRVA